VIFLLRRASVAWFLQREKVTHFSCHSNTQHHSTTTFYDGSHLLQKYSIVIFMICTLLTNGISFDFEPFSKMASSSRPKKAPPPPVEQSNRLLVYYSFLGGFPLYRIITIFWDLGLWDFCKNTSNSFSIGKFCWQYL
jgi:hypothetical protein